MKRFISSVIILAFVIVLLMPVCPVYAVQTLYYNADASNGITASGNSVTTKMVKVFLCRYNKRQQNNLF
ncbi:MAG: hypothetical protein L6V93_08190 [Clostridiales bacterium]|nr:MAG: hypothetical protein L6V93_08190 [Clostridiales bacterium]